MLDNRVVSFFLNEGICKCDFFDYICDKVVYVPSGSDVFWFGCHPIVENGILCDIKVVVPTIESEFDLIVNIHEFTHAIDLFNLLDCYYIDDADAMEERAHKMEKIYLKSNH